MNRIFFHLLLAAGVVVFSQCRQRPHYQADISGIAIEPVTVNRFEKVLFSINPLMLREEIDPYTETFRLFLGDEIDNPLSQQQLYDYMTDPLIVELYEAAMGVWGDLSGLEASLTTAFRYYRHHFPAEPIPQLFSYISGLDISLPVKYSDNQLVIALDLYLGRAFPTYRQAGIPAYQTVRMAPEYLPADIMRMLGEMLLQRGAMVPGNFLDFMIYEGKLLYFLDCMLPDYPDSLKIGYTADQLSWMRENRGFVWSYYLENELLYSSDRQMISRFIGDAPFTTVFSGGSAPRTAAWIGWQIVREYMRRHPETSLQELLRHHDASFILTASRYRGR